MDLRVEKKDKDTKGEIYLQKMAGSRTQMANCMDRQEWHEDEYCSQADEERSYAHGKKDMLMYTLERSSHQTIEDGSMSVLF